MAVQGLFIQLMFMLKYYEQREILLKPINPGFHRCSGPYLPWGI